MDENRGRSDPPAGCYLSLRRHGPIGFGKRACGCERGSARGGPRWTLIRNRGSFLFWSGAESYGMIVIMPSTCRLGLGLKSESAPGRAFPSLWRAWGLTMVRWRRVAIVPRRTDLVIGCRPTSSTRSAALVPSLPLCPSFSSQCLNLFGQDERKSSERRCWGHHSQARSRFSLHRQRCARLALRQQGGR